MSGHSKWKQIKHKKAKADAQRGKIFTRLIKEITVAARDGGGDEMSNPRLRTAVLAAKAANMPASNIERAIKKGTGELPGVAYDEVTYEGYGPGGAALLIECLTDNKNRTVAEIRHLFAKSGGNLAEAGSVAWMFDRKGEITVEMTGLTEEALLEIAIEAGAEDMQVDENMASIITSPDELERVKEALAGKNISCESAVLTMVPKNTVRIEGKAAEQLLKLMELLEDHEDVQNIFANFDIDESILAEFE